MTNTAKLYENDFQSSQTKNDAAAKQLKQKRYVEDSFNIRHKSVEQKTHNNKTEKRERNRKGGLHWTLMFLNASNETLQIFQGLLLLAHNFHFIIPTTKCFQSHSNNFDLSCSTDHAVNVIVFQTNQCEGQENDTNELVNVQNPIISYVAFYIIASGGRKNRIEFTWIQKIEFGNRLLQSNGYHPGYGSRITVSKSGAQFEKETANRPQHK